MKTIYFLITDEDTGEHKLFHNRLRAIDYMYRMCEKWSAILYPSTRPTRSLNVIYPNREDRLKFLYALDDVDINIVFECYFSFERITEEDYFD